MEFIEKQRNDFSIGQGYTRKKCKTILCKECNSDKFIVGVDDWFTAIKCPTCGWEVCIHDG